MNERLLLAELIPEIVEEVDRQCLEHPAGYPADRNGLRLGLANLEDELTDALGEWIMLKRVQNPGWQMLRQNILQLAGIAIRIISEIDKTRKPVEQVEPFECTPD